MKCHVCRERKAKFKLYQASVKKYVDFCGKDCFYFYLQKKFGENKVKRNMGLISEFIIHT